jgi:hypothetical protein
MSLTTGDFHDLIIALRVEASEQELQARRVNNKGIPVYNPICLGRAQAKRNAADRLENILKGLLEQKT